MDIETMTPRNISTAQSGYNGAQLLCRIPSAPTQRDGSTEPLYAATLDPVHPSMKAWAKSQGKANNAACDLRMSRFQSSGKIPPASQTNAIWPHCPDPVWQGDPPRWGDIAAHGHDDYDVAVKNAMAAAQSQFRNEVAFADHESRTQSEIHGELRLVKKTMKLENSPAVVIGGDQARPTSEEYRDWNTDLIKLGMPAEIVPVKVHRKKREGKSAFDKEYSRYRDGFGDDERADAGFDRAGDHITNDGTRKTTGGYQRRGTWYPWFRAALNPDGLSLEPASVEEISGHPTFATMVSLNAKLFQGVSTVELAEKLGVKPNTLTQRFATLGDLKEQSMGVDELNMSLKEWDKAMGKCFIVVRLGDRDYVKVLGPADMSHEAAVVAKQRVLRETISRALTEDKRRLKLRGTALILRWADTAHRIEQAFENSIIYERLVVR